MTNPRLIPVALSVVSWVFLTLAILAVIEIIGSALRGSVHLDFNVLGFWIFFGLRRGSPGWRACALLFIWLAMIVFVIWFIYGFFGSGPAFIKIFWPTLCQYSAHLGFRVIAAVFFALDLWMYRVLTRPDICALFYPDSLTPVA